jgi:hypothetical protein
MATLVLIATNRSLGYLTKLCGQQHNWVMLSISLCGDGIGQELANIRVELKSGLKEWVGD